MRSLLVVVAALCGSTIVASGEEAYQRTGTVLGACLGQQMRDVGGSRMSADAMDSYLKQKCGQLEEQEQNEFLDFFSRTACLRPRLKALHPACRDCCCDYGTDNCTTQRFAQSGGASLQGRNPKGQTEISAAAAPGGQSG